MGSKIEQVRQTAEVSKENVASTVRRAGGENYVADDGRSDSGRSSSDRASDVACDAASESDSSLVEALFRGGNARLKVSLPQPRLKGQEYMQSWIFELIEACML